ncbi:L,D-transpeptidase family protein [Alicyclobacillus fastidiosus]|uniref:L,D-transpeptidase family protein n=1 Tax=Alicyclobacillus fastidiosus TaxID=392011 RepID=A0ABY6ZME4_9BACL|nr:L,D-transpeptidase family protein [Alicyclobacillus fastidiosus]WAH43371.1 L,D-transpeptidase family protein [Alicyclobacillus fastidiosus]GMA65432.1 hypothetical protein GCM10025859_58720 [Alicyclobacillus fastidiosus]
MQHGQKLSILGILIFLGIIQTGCGALSRVPLAPSVSNDTDNKAAVSISSVTNRKGTTNGTSISITTHPVSPYPSLGLGMSGPEVLALNERLAELGYLPVAVNAATQPAITLSNLDSPPKVSFAWRYGAVPSELTSEWSEDTYTEMTRGAVIAVEHVNGLPIDGMVGEAVWKAILGQDAVQNPNPYTYVLVTKNPAPEELRVWQAGKWVYQSIANTGVAGAPSTNGTFAIYERLASQTMTGTNPDGTKYIDPGVPYINYYDGGQAIHGFPRASYGFPQSVGCVELPISNAKVVWSLVNYGTLVTVEGDYVPPTSTQTNTQASTEGTTTSKSTSDSSTASGKGSSSESKSTPTGQKTGNTTGKNPTGNSSSLTSNTTGNSGGNTTSAVGGNTTDKTGGNTTQQGTNSTQNTSSKTEPTPTNDTN